MIFQRTLFRRLAGVATCTRGAMAVWAALALPALSLVAIGASELSVVAADKTRLQDAADAAALAAANELAVDSSAAVADRGARSARFASA